MSNRVTSLSVFRTSVETLRRGALALGIATLLAGPAAAAVTFGFDQGQNGPKGRYNDTARNMYSTTVDGITLWAFAGLYGTDASGAVTSVDENCADGSCGFFKRVLRKGDKFGLGVNGWFDPNGDIDGFFGNDLLTLVFDVPVILQSVTFRKVDANDKVDLIVDGALARNEVPVTGNSPFSFGGQILGRSFGFGADDPLDNFRVSEIVVAHVPGDASPEVEIASTPLPAAGLLLIGALGGLGYAARRRKSG